MRQGPAGFQTIGSGLGRAGQLLLLARGYAHSGQVAAALDTVDEALTWMRATGVRGFEAEATRLRGELLMLGQAPPEQVVRLAEAHFGESIALVRRADARWWKLRATASLCRLITQTCAAHDPRRAEARQMLAQVYGRFSEGFDTLDLREARALLEELAQEQPLRQPVAGCGGAPAPSPGDVRR